MTKARWNVEVEGHAQTTDDCVQEGQYVRTRRAVSDIKVNKTETRRNHNLLREKGMKTNVGS